MYNFSNMYLANMTMMETIVTLIYVIIKYVHVRMIFPTFVVKSHCIQSVIKSMSVAHDFAPWIIRLITGFVKSNSERRIIVQM